MTLKEKLKQALELFEEEAAPTQEGENAGSRTEGHSWKNRMKELLEVDGFEVVTATAKSSNGEKVDGNAHERISYKMMQFKQSPLTRDTMLVVAVNSAFHKYGSHVVGDIREQAAYLNGLDGRAQILVLSREKDYKNYFEYLEKKGLVK